MNAHERLKAIKTAAAAAAGNLLVPAELRVGLAALAEEVEVQGNLALALGALNAEIEKLHSRLSALELASAFPKP